MITVYIVLFVFMLIIAAWEGINLFLELLAENGKIMGIL